MPILCCNKSNYAFYVYGMLSAVYIFIKCLWYVVSSLLHIAIYLWIIYLWYYKSSTYVLYFYGMFSAVNLCLICLCYGLFSKWQLQCYQPPTTYVLYIYGVSFVCYQQPTYVIYVYCLVWHISKVIQTYFFFVPSSLKQGSLAIKLSTVLI